MKKLLIIFVLFITTFTLQACQNDDDVIKVIATTTPHGEILEYVRPALLELGYELEIIITSDYYLPNPAVAAGDADANFFQHIPFLNLYNSQNPNAPLYNALGVHIEPIGLYATGSITLESVPQGATVLISNSTSDHGRALNLLEQAGLITLSEGFDILSTDIDFNEVIVSNPKGLVIEADVAPDFLIAAYNNNEANLYIINSNYVLEGGYNPSEDAIFIESATDNPYVNILAVLEDRLDDPKIEALIEVLSSPEVKAFINENYNGAVIPA